MQSDPPTAKSLAQLVSQVIQFQEDYLGKSVKSPPFTRLPVSKCQKQYTVRAPLLPAVCMFFKPSF